MKAQKLTYSIIMGVFIYLLILTLTYEGETVIFPLFVLSLGIMLCVLKLSALHFPKFGKAVDAQGALEDIGKNVESLDAFLVDDEDQSPEQVAARKQIRRKREIFTYLWTLGFIFMICMTGFYVASLVMVFVYIRFYGKLPLRNSLIISVSTPLFIYLCFDLGLNVNLYSGYLFSLFV